MNAGQTVFSQLMDHLPSYEFQKCVERYRGDAPIGASLAATSIWPWLLLS
jgi:hypothetical protein